MAPYHLEIKRYFQKGLIALNKDKDLRLFMVNGKFYEIKIQQPRTTFRQEQYETALKLAETAVRNDEEIRGSLEAGNSLLIQLILQ